MKRVLALYVLSSAAVLGASFSGTLIDNSCKGTADPARHPRQCAVMCAKSGYGLVMADGKFLKFDDAGNAQALALLKSSTKEKDLKATVEGDREGTILKVKTIALD